MRIGLSTAAFGFVSAMITLLKITGAVAGTTFLGVYIGTAIGICAGILAVGGVIAAIGHTRQQAIADRERSEEVGNRLGLKSRPYDEKDVKRTIVK
jgi:F0F1-type ATP synthase assembly protein I